MAIDKDIESWISGEQNGSAEPLIEEGEVKNNRRSIWMIIFSTMVAVCGSFIFGSSVGFSAPSQFGIMNDMGLSLSEFAVFGSILTIGAMIGAIASGRIADFLGRKGAMRVSALFCMIGWLAIYFGKNDLLLDFGRISTGFGTGVFSYVVPVFIAEIAPKNLRGGLTTLNQFMICGGLSVTYILGAIVSWRELALIGLIPCLVLLLGLFFIPESPRWLAKVGKQELFEESLHRLHGKDADISEEAAEIQDYIETLNRLPHARILDLFQRKYIHSTIAGVGLMAFQQFGGINGIVFYSSQTFVSAGFSSGNFGTILIGAIQLPITALGAILMDNCGRKPLLLISSSGTFLGCFIAALSFFLKEKGINAEWISILTLCGILSACWAMAKSWLDVQVDLHLASFQHGRDAEKQHGDAVGISSHGPSAGPETWPDNVVDQQPRDFPSLLQKLHSGEIVHEAVLRACKEQHRQVEMNLMLCDIPYLLDLIWLWISPSEDEHNGLRPHGDPQMIRFGAHLSLLLRYLLDDELKDAFKEKLMTVGDNILQMYAIFLFSEHHEELVGIYASQISRHYCIDLFVEMMELRLNSSIHIKHKLFRSAIEYLPFSMEDQSKASFEDIIERVLSRSREIKASKCDERPSDVAEQHRLQSLQKAMAIQWLCFTPPTTVRDFETISAKLLIRALIHSNVLFREFALISMWRIPKMPIGAHMLLSFLAEPLKQPKDTLLSFDDYNVLENLQEFEDWREYYSCDATYRSWLKLDWENSAVPPAELSLEEKESAIAAARETLNSSLSLLLREETPWLNAIENCSLELTSGIFLDLYAYGMLCLPSGECLCPDATMCTTLTSALYSSVSEEEALKRQLMVNVSVSHSDNYCVEVALRCLAIEGDGLGLHESNDGGLLATVMAAGFKGELARFQAGVTLEISRMDAWYSDTEASFQIPATYVVKGLCRKCCLPEIILRCMQISVSLAESGESNDRHDELIEVVASGMLPLFSQQQLQEFLLFERHCSLYEMELREEP